MSPLESSDSYIEANTTIFNGLTVDAHTLREIEQIRAQGYILFRTGTPGDPSFRGDMHDMERLKRNYRHAQGSATNKHGELVTIDLLFLKD